MRTKLILTILLGLALWTVVPVPVQACTEYVCEKKKDNEEAYHNCIRDKKACLESKLQEVTAQKSTLSSTIKIFTSKIAIQEVNITQTIAEIAKLEREVDLLGQRIETLDFSLDQLTGMLLARVQHHYKQQKEQPSILVDLNRGIGGATTHAKYIQQASGQTAQIMHLAEAQRQVYDQQKDQKQIKQDQLAVKQKLLQDQKQELDSQKAAQQRLLTQTQNSEAEYQKQLAAVLAEYRAIQAIISGGGKENKVGDVKAGDSVASVINGRSCNSSNTHLHFMVTKNGVAQNPFTYLKSIDARNCSGSSCDSSDGDAFNPSGSWEWPVAGPITLNQGYGSTWAVRHTWVSRIYSLHNGIDINGSSSTVRAVADGTLIRGVFSGGGGCALQYVKIKHADDLITWYLHVDY